MSQTAAAAVWLMLLQIICALLGAACWTTKKVLHQYLAVLSLNTRVLVHDHPDQPETRTGCAFSQIPDTVVCSIASWSANLTHEQTLTAAHTAAYFSFTALKLLPLSQLSFNATFIARNWRTLHNEHALLLTSWQPHKKVCPRCLFQLQKLVQKFAQLHVFKHRLYHRVWGQDRYNYCNVPQEQWSLLAAGKLPLPLSRAGMLDINSKKDHQRRDIDVGLGL